MRRPLLPFVSAIQSVPDPGLIEISDPGVCREVTPWLLCLLNGLVRTPVLRPIYSKVMLSFMHDLNNTHLACES
jgi:hypothetical protein